MISTPLVICLAVASAAIVIALMMWRPRNRFPASGKTANWLSRDATFASMLLSLAAAVGLARAEAERSGDGNPDGGHAAGTAVISITVAVLASRTAAVSAAAMPEAAGSS